MNNRHLVLNFLTVTSLLLASSFADAHRAWILPSATNLSGESPWVTFDAAVSNTLFVPEHVALPLASLQVTNPSGEAVEVSNLHKGKFRASFDLNLIQEGTYKVAVTMNGLRASWKDENGKSKRWPKRGQVVTEADFARDVPKNADGLKVLRNYWRQETFVSSGAPSDKVLQATGTGLELVAATHPNDLFSGESAKFRFMFEGEPAAGAKVSVVAGHMRYRNQQNQLDMVADEQGYITLTWPEAGMYLLEAEYEDDRAKAPATMRKGSYGATLEVLPQ